MAVSPFSDDDVMSINMTPLVDVILVLLILLLVTVLVTMHHAVRIALPHASSQPEDVTPAQVDVSIRVDDPVLWGDQVADAAALCVKIAGAAQANPQSELHLRVDRTVAYEQEADLMSEA
ncbi:biopolymer transporter ExbD [Burkholderia sp. WAC0059]|uniref:ExbD/TolR family protein n=1 Tax=Burkholderia sp. WAC0059 TaxID=2066022 RepID=UPI000C7E86AC|nr:biopolymer transporter ExbD [Burkholderia sp. WAC0059]PLZ00408.1 biopolymer transporter ExbD [Burkholderia sp. WAC0059]